MAPKDASTGVATVETIMKKETRMARIIPPKEERKPLSLETVKVRYVAGTATQSLQRAHCCLMESNESQLHITKSFLKTLPYRLERKVLFYDK